MTTRRLEKSMIDELLSYEIYSSMARNTRNQVLSKLLSEFAEMEKRHYEILCEIASELGSRCINKGFKYRLKKLLLNLLSKVTGPGLILFFMELSERAAVVDYWEMINEPGLSKYHEKLFEILRDEVFHEQGLYAELKGFEIRFMGLKDSIYGMIDALVEIEAGVIGIAMATSPVIAGIAGLLASIAGSLSMASGAYLSSKSENRVLGIESKSREIMFSIKPEVFIERLRHDYSDLGDGIVNEISNLVHKEPRLLSILSVKREHEEIDPRTAAIHAGVFYILGSIAPVLPFLLGLPLSLSIVFSIALTQVTLFLLTALISITTGSSFLKLYSEYSAIVLLATITTVLIGRLARSIIGVEV